MKPFIVITSLALLAIGIIFFLKGCPNPTTSKDKVIDSLKWVIRTDSISGEAKYKSDSSLIHNLTYKLQDTTAALQQARIAFSVRGAKILSANKDLHAALIIHDTLEVYKNAQYIAFQIDSIATENWNVNRELGKQIVLNEQLRLADSAALANCRGQITQTRNAYSALAQNYEVQHQQDMDIIKKTKRKNKLWGIGGGILGAAIRSVFK